MSVHSPRRPAQALMPNWPMVPDWSDLVARFESMPPWTSMGGHTIRVEENLDADRYTVRAELPGVDPAKDVDISVREGQLTIKAERSEKKEERTRSEFRYGSFYRSMLLPKGADEDAIDATYSDGILTVSIPLTASSSQERHVEVKKMSRQ